MEFHHYYTINVNEIIDWNIFFAVGFFFFFSFSSLQWQHQQRAKIDEFDGYSLPAVIVVVFLLSHNLTQLDFFFITLGFFVALQLCDDPNIYMRTAYGWWLWKFLFYSRIIFSIIPCKRVMFVHKTVFQMNSMNWYE